MSIKCKRSMRILTIYGTFGICILAIAAAGITVVLAVAAIGAKDAAILIPMAVSVPMIALALWMLPRYLKTVLRVDISEKRVDYYTVLRRIQATPEHTRIRRGQNRMWIGIRDSKGRIRVLQFMDSFYKPADAEKLRGCLPQ